MNLEKAGFVGLGQMGAGMARNLLSAVSSLYVWDVNDDAMQGLVSAGAKEADDLPQLAQTCDVVMLCLPDATAVHEVLFGDAGIVSSAHDSLLVLDASTLERTDSITFSVKAAEQRVRYCDCPVSGLPRRAADGTLTMMFGGPTELFHQAQPMLASMSSAVLHCGDVGSGQAMKAVNNIIYNINIAALCEVLPMAIAAGLEPEVLVQLVTEGSSRSFAAEHFVPKLMTRTFSDDFPMESAYKDIVNIKELARQCGAMMPVTDAMIKTYDAALAAGYGQEPKHAMVKVYEQHLNKPGLVGRK